MNYKESSCQCNICKSMCKHAACIGSPSDIRKISNAGFKDHLEPACVKIDDKPHYLIVPKENEKGCVFLTEKGLCMLHDLGMKPEEGRLASHDNNGDGIEKRDYVARKWNSTEGFDLYEELTGR